MKQLLAILSAALVSVSAIAAGNEFAFDVQVTKNGALITKMSAVAAENVTTPLTAVREITYIASASRKEGGEINLVPGIVKTGFSGTFYPSVEPSGKIKARVTMDISDLKGMPMVAIGDGLNIQMPDLETQHLDQELTFDKSAPVTLGMGDYTIQIMATKL